MSQDRDNPDRITWGQWARKHHVRLTLLAVALLAALGWLGFLAFFYLAFGLRGFGD
jgi:hypothetical protein